MRRIFLFLLSSLLFYGCSTTLNIGEAVNSYKGGNFERAYSQVLDKKEEYEKSDGALIYHLDAGLLAHYSSLYTESNRHLERSETIMRDLYTESIVANVASYLVNESTKEYQGEDYEDLYVNLFKALNYIHLKEGEAALVELRRFNEKQQFLQNKYDTLFKKVERASPSTSLNFSKPVSLRFSSSALGNYLMMVVSRDLQEREQALFSYNQVKEAFSKQPNLYPFTLPSTLDKEITEPQRGSKRVNIVAFSGLSPYKRESVQRSLITESLYIKIALPLMESRPTQVSSIEVIVDNKERFFLEPIENLSLIAQETFLLNRSYLESKAVLRAFVKATGTTLIEAGTAQVASQSDNPEVVELIGSLLSFFSLIFTEVSERADLRISHFFPDQFWVGGVTLPIGTHFAQIIYRDSKNRVVYKDYLENLEVKEGIINLWESIYPR